MARHPRLHPGPALPILAHNALAAALHSRIQRFDNLARIGKPTRRNTSYTPKPTLEIEFAAFTANDAPHQRLVVYQAGPASSTAFAELRSRVNHRQAVQVVQEESRRFRSDT
ncbi:hypothetical protein PV387_40210 [Streptomyces sp. ME02-6987-2C]|uniref:hypothetical protein n=1 Tax=unclassified Streptomyces TaxID=2593676 RepID=UPI0029A94CB1|nr:MULTISPECIES: hypothetical protein [unclassified Streptomyces]MDX3372138.1 hypothetical protein [Streptomyces sp. ME02-6987-2C]MDX3427180.1 hypothetical protein [Streptomyces sp. ME02-6985-2c]